MRKIITILILLGSLSDGVAQTAYITNYNDYTVSVINVATHTVFATINVGARPWGVSVSPNGSKVYITNNLDNTVSVISTATNIVTATIAVGNGPYGICVSPDGSKVYVTNNIANTLSVINAVTDTVLGTFPIDITPQGISISPDGSKLYVANFNVSRVSVINTSTNTIWDSIAVNTGPYGLNVSPDGSKVYVSCCGNNRITIINTSDNSVSSSIITGSYPEGIAVSSDGSKIYAANASGYSVDVLDSGSNVVLTSIAVGYWPLGISVSPDGSKVYVANDDGNTVSVINTTTNTVTSTITVGHEPVAFGNFITPFIQCIANTPVISQSANTTFCQGDSVILTSSPEATYLWSNGSTTQSIVVNNSGNYSVFIIDGNNCTATSAITPVTVNPTYSQNISSSICQGNSYTFPDGIISSVDTIDTSYLTSINLCDSIIITTLTVNPTYSQIESAIICQGETFTFPDGIISSVDSIDTSYLSTINSCDSIITTTLTVNPSYTQNISVSICQGNTFTFPDGTTSNTYTIQTSHLTTINSCDSLIITTLTVNTVDTSVTVSIPTFTSNANNATYHWMDCNAMDTIPGAINQSYTAISNGSYAVIVTQNGCTDTSSCYDIFSVGINDNHLATGIYVYPNPVSETLTIRNYELGIRNGEIIITDVLGNEVYHQAIINQQSSIINISNLSNGVYFYEIRSGLQIPTSMRGKFVVEK